MRRFLSSTAILAAGVLISIALMNGSNTPGPSIAATPATDSLKLPAIAVKALVEAQEDFTYDSKPIHPGMVNQFLGWLSDGGPITLAIDVRAGSDTNQYRDDEVHQQDGQITFVTDRGDEQSGWFSYERIGVLADKTQVLHTMDCGGGSGVFESIMFVRFRLQSHAAEDASPDYRLVMEVISDHPIGDRDDGTITVMNDHVVAGASRYRSSDVILRPTF